MQTIVGGQCELNLYTPGPPLTLHVEPDATVGLLVEGLHGVVVRDHGETTALAGVEHLPNWVTEQDKGSQRLGLERWPERDGAAHRVLTRASGGGGAPGAGLTEKEPAARQEPSHGPETAAVAVPARHVPPRPPHPRRHSQCTLSR